MKSKIYKQAEYYEIAFSFIDAKKQVKLFEKFIKKYSKIKVNSVLDIACGTALQLREMAKKGYEAIGLDMSDKMLKYLNKKTKEEKLNIKTIEANMNKFTIKNKVDFAYIMMGSFVYTENNKKLLEHLNSVANSLNKGGLYLIENLDINCFDQKFYRPQSWTIKKGKIKVKTYFKLTPKNLLLQTAKQTIKLEVEDNGKKSSLIDEETVKFLSPEEFKLLIEKNKKFDFLGYFERDDTKLLKNNSSNNIALLRRK